MWVESGLGIASQGRATGCPSHLTIARRLLTTLFRARCRVKAQRDKASTNAGHRGEEKNATTEPIVSVLGPLPPGYPHGARSCRSPGGRGGAQPGGGARP